MRTTPGSQKLVSLPPASGPGSASQKALNTAYGIVRYLATHDLTAERVEVGRHRSIIIIYVQGGERIVSVACHSGERIDVVVGPVEGA